MHGCRVVSATELASNRRVGDAHLFSQEVHDDLAGEGQALFSTLSQDIFYTDIEILRNGLNDVFWRDRLFYCIDVKAVDDGPNRFEGGPDVFKLVDGDDLIERPLEFSDV